MALIVGDEGQLEPDAGDDPARWAGAEIIQRLALKFELDMQTFEALDGQHQRLAARVERLAAVVEMMERLMTG